MLRDFDRKHAHDDEEAFESEPLEKGNSNARIKKAAALLRDFSRDPNNDNDDNNNNSNGSSTTGTTKRRRKRGERPCLGLHLGHVLLLLRRRNKRLVVALGLAVLVVLTVTARHLVRHHRRDKATVDAMAARSLPKQHCSFRKYRRVHCPGSVRGTYQGCVLDLIFNTIGTTNKQFVEIVAFAQNSTVIQGGGGGGSRRDRVVRRRRLDEATDEDNTGGDGTDAQANRVHPLIPKGFQGNSFHIHNSGGDARHDNYHVAESTIAKKLSKAHVPKDVDFVSIDVHSIDLWLLYGLLQGGYRPRVLAVQFNANFPLDMFVSIDQRGGPSPLQDNDTVLYSASAAALNHVAQLYGYHVVEIMMSKLDMFFVRNDILQTTCSNYDFMDSFPTLALVPKLLGYPHHTQCDATVAKEHLVDVPLVLAGKLNEARAMAHLNIEELNIRRLEAKLPQFCKDFE